VSANFANGRHRYFRTGYFWQRQVIEREKGTNMHLYYRYRFVALSMVLLALVALGGCTKPEDNGGAPPATSSGKVGSAGKVDTSVAADEKLKDEVTKKISGDASLKSEPITVEVKDGFVSLTGTVSTNEVKVKAESLVRDMEGVNGVRAEKLVAK
jgi:hypothetical protein